MAKIKLITVKFLVFQHVTLHLLDTYYYMAKITKTFIFIMVKPAK